MTNEPTTPDTPETDAGPIPDDVAATAPLSIADIKAAIIADRDRITDAIAAKRAQRDQLNADIRVLSEQLVEANRLAAATTPRKTKS